MCSVRGGIEVEAVLVSRCNECGILFFLYGLVARLEGPERERGKRGIELGWKSLASVHMVLMVQH